GLMLCHKPCFLVLGRHLRDYKWIAVAEGLGFLPLRVEKGERFPELLTSSPFFPDKPYNQSREYAIGLWLLFLWSVVGTVGWKLIRFCGLILLSVGQHYPGEAEFDAPL